MRNQKDEVNKKATFYYFQIIIKIIFMTWLKNLIKVFEMIKLKEKKKIFLAI